MADSVMLPQLTTLVELSNKINEIVAWTEANPVDDHVFHIPLPDCLKNKREGTSLSFYTLQSLDNKDAYIAGSTALYWYVRETNTACQGKWKPSDADLFFLNQEYNNRVQISTLDIVQCKEKTVEELLINFDLPICRAALGLNYDFWISAQCIAAVHKRKQNCPAYLRDKYSFKRILETAMKEGDEKYVKIQAATIHEQLYARFTERVKKYQDRGFGVNWIETNKIIPWVTNRFHYGEWLMTELPVNTVKATVVPTAGCDCQHCKNVGRGRY
jgi:hypothetical protein